MRQIFSARVRADALSVPLAAVATCIFLSVAGAVQSEETNPSMSLLYSGHSLTASPLPNYVEMIADAAGARLNWNEQQLYGSSIKERLAEPASSSRQPLDKQGQPVSFSAATGAGPYSALIISEQNNVLDSFAWQQTEQTLRAYHEAFAAANPSSKTFFFVPWSGLSSRDQPGDWITFERAAYPVWRCMVGRVDQATPAQVDPHPVLPLPASIALAGVTERLMRPENPLKLSAATDVVAFLFTDDVHLTEAGTYFMALFTYAWLTSAPPPVGSWAPESLTQAEASELQAAAREIFLDLQEQEKTAATDLCVKPGSFAWTYTGFSEKRNVAEGMGPLTARLVRLQRTLRLYWEL